MAAHRNRAPRYRIVAYELEGKRATIVMDTTGVGFVAAVATIAEGSMRGELGSGGPADVQEHIALLIASESDLGGGPAGLPPPR